jgi:hypothetical protein
VELFVSHDRTSCPFEWLLTCNDLLSRLGGIARYRWDYANPSGTRLGVRSHFPMPEAGGLQSLPFLYRPPFVKHATISFMGLPKVEISAIPMIDLPVKLNAMNIPGLSTFISNSINTAIDEYGKSASSLVACVIVC